MKAMSYVEQVAKMLGVNLCEEFMIKPTEYAKILGHKENNNIFRFDSQLVRKGYDDGWSEWYGFGCDRILHLLIIGLYEVVKIDQTPCRKEDGKNDN